MNQLYFNFKKRKKRKAAWLSVQSVSAGSTSGGSTNHGWKNILEIIIPGNSKRQNLNLLPTASYVHSIYSALGTISDLEMIESEGEGVSR